MKAEIIKKGDKFLIRRKLLGFIPIYNIDFKEVYCELGFISFFIIFTIFTILKGWYIGYIILMPIDLYIQHLLFKKEYEEEPKI